MALTNIPLTKAFMLNYEEEQQRLEKYDMQENQMKENQMKENHRIPQKSIAKKILDPTIHILPPLIHIQVKTATGKSIYIKINPIDTILQLKKQIYLQEDVSLESQRIIFGGKQLDDHHTLCHYNITDGTTLHIILRLRGGMFHKSSSRADFVSLNYSNKMERGLSMLDYMKRESSRKMVLILEDFEEVLKNTKNDVEIDMVYDLIRQIYSE